MAIICPVQYDNSWPTCWSECQYLSQGCEHFSLLPYLLTSLPRLISGRKESCRYNGVPFQKEPPLMHYRKFGRAGWNVSEIGYGMVVPVGRNSSDHAPSASGQRRP